MPMFPKKWNKADNPHYPMLKSDGNPYLFLEGDKLRKTKFYFQTGLNQPIFYQKFSFRIEIIIKNKKI